MENPGPTNIVARRVTDDLIAFSGETAVPKYMKFFLVQKLAETSRFVNRMHDEVDTIRSCIAQLTAVIAKLQAMDDQDEVHDSLLAAKDAKCGDESKLLLLNEVIVEALEEIETQETNVKILDGENDVMEMGQFGMFLLFAGYVHMDVGCLKCVLTMAALYILDKLTEIVDFCLAKRRCTVVFVSSSEDESFIGLICDLCSGLRLSLTKNRRLIAELEALGQLGDALKPLEYTREMVASDSVTLGVLEQLLAGIHVGMRLKAGYVVDMEET
ncbi:hypothetical protein Tco_1337568 [Tanacetum coccineum]